MPDPANALESARQQTVFAILETTRGTLAFPPAASPIITAAGFIDMNQNPTFTDSEEIANTRDVLSQFEDIVPAGTFSIPIYARPSGTAGTAPMGDILFQSLLGGRVVNAGTSVVYSPAMVKPSFSLWAMRGDTLFFGAGAVAESLKLSVNNKGAVKMNIGGSFFQMGWAGTDGVQTTASLGASSVVVYDATKYTVGAVIYDATTNDHATNGYTVTGVNTTTNTLTVSPVLVGAWTAGDVVAGYLPSGVSVGNPLAAKLSSLTVNSVNQVIESLDLNYEDKVKMLDDEITASGFPQAYIENLRKITGSCKSHLRRNDMTHFLDGLNGAQRPIVASFGTVAGSKLALNMPKCVVEVPQITANAPALDISIAFTALGTSGEDSMTMTWL